MTMMKIVASAYNLDTLDMIIKLAQYDIYYISLNYNRYIYLLKNG